jgi:hypothetical protein
MRMIGIVGAALLLMTSSTDAEAYKPTNMNAGTNLLVAFASCRGPLARGNAGLVGQSNYDGYTQGRDKALAVDPQLKEWDEIEPYQLKVLGGTPKELLPKCDRLMTEWATGVNADASPEVNPLCIPNIDHYIKVARSYLADPKSMAFNARKNLEYARYTLTRKGAFPGTRVCDTNDHFKTKATPLKQSLSSLETEVEKREQERGVKFAGIDRGSVPIYNETTTGKRVDRPDRY